MKAAPAGAEAEAAKAEGEAKAGEGEAKAGEGEAKTAEGEAKTAEGEAKAAEGEAKPEAPAAESIALSEAKLASSTTCEGTKGCVDDETLALLQAKAKAENETTGKLEQLKQTVVTSADGVTLRWLSYELPFKEEGMQYDELTCYTALESREGQAPKEIAHECDAECTPGGEVVDLLGSDVPELVTYCEETNIDSTGMLEIYGLGAEGWTKLTRYMPVCGDDDPENESHFSFSREGIVLRCHNLNPEGDTDDEMVDAPLLTLKWNGSAFAPG